MDLNLISIDKELRKLEEILNIYDISNKTQFKQWYEDFKEIYSSKHADLQLYIISALLYFVGNLFIFRFLINNEKEIPKNDIDVKFFEDIKENYENKFGNNSLFDFDYFDPLFNLSKTEDLNLLYSLLSKMACYIFELQIQPEFIFDFLNQNIISPIIRHKAGEYYTPSFLVKKMVDDTYDFGESVLDPCCGTGNFLIEIVKHIIATKTSENEKIKAINNLYGYDINPISIFLTKINVLFLTKDYLPKIKLNLFNFDSLLQNSDVRFDLVIGNPPWYTFSDINSIDYQKKVKDLAEELEIKPLPKNILNIEISSLFFYRARDIFMKDNAKIFFVITKGVITGSHASRFRNFNGFNNIRIWYFDSQIEKIFNIDFICLYAQNAGVSFKNEVLEIPAIFYALENKIDKLDYFKNFKLKILRKDTLIPYSVEKKANKSYTKKLISKEVKEKLLPNIISEYKKLFHKGADLNPRNLIFITQEEIDESLVRISPDQKIFKRAKKPWDKKEFTEETVEKKNIFKVIKSTELVKFGIFDFYYVFLPLSRGDLAFNYDALSKNAKNFYDKINNIYLKHKKETTKNKSLMDNLNRWAKLINKRQLSKIKVVYNNSGSVLNSAVIQGDFLVTGDLSFFDTDDLKEAHYLAAILNSHTITEQIKITKSSRHIFKLPFEVDIKKFNSNNKNHIKLAELGLEGHKIAESVISETRGQKVSKIKLQNQIGKKIEDIQEKIDLVLRDTLTSSNLKLETPPSLDKSKTF